MVCTGPQTDLAATITGKPWIVYIHGGEWAECTNINEYLTPATKSLCRRRILKMISI